MTEYSNEVKMTGYLTKDPIKRATSYGTPITQFRIGTSRTYRTHDGASKQEVTFIDINAFGKQATEIADNFHKGSHIFVKGHLKLDQWKTQEGENKSKISIGLEDYKNISKNMSKEEVLQTEATSNTISRTEAAQHVSSPIQKYLEKNLEHDEHDEITR